MQSSINKKLDISQDKWVVSIMRKVEKNENDYALHVVSIAKEEDLSYVFKVASSILQGQKTDPKSPVLISHGDKFYICGNDGKQWRLIELEAKSIRGHINFPIKNEEVAFIKEGDVAKEVCDEIKRKKGHLSARTINTHHAFLVVEGVDRLGKVFFRRYDFCQDQMTPIKGIVRINESDYAGIDPLAAKPELDNMLRQDEIYSKSWNITKEQGADLRKDVIDDSKNPPNYVIWGSESFSTKIKSIGNGHSCFTWAREKLLKLKDKQITLPMKFSDVILAIPDLYITGNENEKEPTSGEWLSKRCTIS